MNIKDSFAKISLAIYLIASVFIISSCNDDDDETETAMPTISGVSPEEAAPEAVITLTGTNFSATASENSVSIGGASAIVSAASATSITCEVPTLDAGQADITVTVDGESSTAYTGFTVLEAVTAPTVSSFSPDGGSVGDEVVISGSDFGTDASVLTVTINDVEQSIESVSDTEITITLASKTFSGNVVVAKSGLKDSADAVYNYQVTYGTPEVLVSELVVNDLATDQQGRIYASKNSGILVFSEEGVPLDTLVHNESSSQGIYIDEDNILYVGCFTTTGARVLSLDLDTYPQNSGFDTLFVNSNSDIDAVDFIAGGENESLYIVSYDVSTTEYVLLLIKQDGNSSELLRQTASICGVWYSESEDLIYYFESDQLYTMDVDGANGLAVGSSFDYGTNAELLQTSWGDLLHTARNQSYLMQMAEDYSTENIMDLSSYIDGVYPIVENKDGDLLLADFNAAGDLIKISIK